MPLQITESTKVNNGLLVTLIDTSFSKPRPKNCPAVSYQDKIYIADKTNGLLLADQVSKEITHAFPVLKSCEILLNDNYLYLLGKNDITVVDLSLSPKLKVHTNVSFLGTGLNMVLDNMFLYVISWPFYLHTFDVSYEEQPRLHQTIELPKGDDVVFKSLVAYHDKRFVIRTDNPERPVIINLNFSDKRRCRIGNANDLVRTMA